MKILSTLLKADTGTARVNGAVDGILSGRARVRRLMDLTRERGWASWTRTRPEGLAPPPD